MLFEQTEIVPFCASKLHCFFYLLSSIVGQCEGHHFSMNYYSVLEAVF